MCHVLIIINENFKNLLKGIFESGNTLSSLSLKVITINYRNLVQDKFFVTVSLTVAFLPSSYLIVFKFPCSSLIVVTILFHCSVLHSRFLLFPLEILHFGMNSFIFFPFPNISISFQASQLILTSFFLFIFSLRFY